MTFTPAPGFHGMATILVAAQTTTGEHIVRPLSVYVQKKGARRPSGDVPSVIVGGRAAPVSRR